MTTNESINQSHLKVVNLSALSVNIPDILGFSSFSKSLYCYHVLHLLFIGKPVKEKILLNLDNFFLRMFKNRTSFAFKCLIYYNQVLSTKAVIVASKKLDFDKQSIEVRDNY